MNKNDMAPSRKPETWALLIILSSTFIRTYIAFQIPPLADEAYYYSLGIHFHLSYFDHPPITYWMSGLGGLLGDRFLGNIGFAAVRLPFILLFSGSNWLLFLIGRRLFGSKPGLYAAFLVNLTLYFPAAGIFALPEGPLVFFWLACSWCLIRIFFGPEDDHALLMWLAAGSFLGLCLLTKYHAVFIPFGAALFVLTQTRQRWRIRSLGPYLGMAAAGLVFLPVLIWNYQHEWISFAYQFCRGATFKGLLPGQFAMNLAGQAMLMTPWIWIALFWRLLHGLKSGPSSQRTWFLSSMAIGPIFIFSATSLYSGQWFFFHWPAIGYLLLFPALGAETCWLRRWLVPSTIMSLLTGLILTSQLATGWMSSIDSPFPITISKWAKINYDMSGSKGLVAYLDQKGLGGRENLFLFANNYMDSGRIGWALREKYPVKCFSKSDLAKSYAFVSHPAGWLGADGLLLSRSDFYEQDIKDVSPYFRRFTQIGSVEIKNGYYEQTLHICLFEDMRSPYPLPYGAVTDFLRAPEFETRD